MSGFVFYDGPSLIDGADRAGKVSVAIIVHGSKARRFVPIAVAA
jgi:hypothetical protein